MKNHVYCYNGAIKFYSQTHYIPPEIQKKIICNVLDNISYMGDEVSILDIGCGDGSGLLLPLMEELLNMNVFSRIYIVGVDNVDNMLERFMLGVRNNYKDVTEIKNSNYIQKLGVISSDLYGKVEINSKIELILLKKNINSISDFYKNSFYKMFDNVFLFFTLHHLVNWRDSLKEFNKWLREGGNLFIEERINDIKYMDGDLYIYSAYDKTNDIKYDFLNTYNILRNDLFYYNPEIKATNYNKVIDLLVPVYEEIYERKYEWEIKNIKIENILKWIQNRVFTNFWAGLREEDTKRIVKELENKYAEYLKKKINIKDGIKLYVMKRKNREISSVDVKEFSFDLLYKIKSIKKKNLINFIKDMASVYVTHGFFNSDILGVSFIIWDVSKIHGRWISPYPLLINRNEWTDEEDIYYKLYLEIIKKYKLSFQKIIFNYIKDSYFVKVQKKYNRDEITINKLDKEIVINLSRDDIINIKNNMDLILKERSDSFNKENQVHIKGGIYWLLVGNENGYEYMKNKDIINKINNLKFKISLKGRKDLRSINITEENGGIKDIERVLSFLKILFVIFEEMYYIFDYNENHNTMATNKYKGGSVILFTKKPLSEQKLSYLKYLSYMGFERLLQISWEIIYSMDVFISSLQSAASAIMARNMSHNIGSHVLADIIVTQGSNIGREQLVSFSKYLQNRMDFIAQVTTEIPHWAPSVLFFNQLMREFYDNYILLDRIAVSEGLRAYKWGKWIDSETRGKIIVRVAKDEKDPNNKDNNKVQWIINEYDNGTDTQLNFNDISVAIPGGIVGYHAFYSIMENIIRNSAKHDYATRRDRVLPNVEGKEYDNKRILYVSINNKGKKGYIVKEISLEGVKEFKNEEKIENINEYYAVLMDSEVFEYAKTKKEEEEGEKGEKEGCPFIEYKKECPHHGLDVCIHIKGFINSKVNGEKNPCINREDSHLDSYKLFVGIKTNDKNVINDIISFQRSMLEEYPDRRSFHLLSKKEWEILNGKIEEFEKKFNPNSKKEKEENKDKNKEEKIQQAFNDIVDYINEMPLRLNIKIDENKDKDYVWVTIWTDMPHIYKGKDKKEEIGWDWDVYTGDGWKPDWKDKVKNNNGNNNDEGEKKIEDKDLDIFAVTNDKLMRSFVDKDTGKMRKEDWGMAEMKICASFLQQRHILEVGNEGKDIIKEIDEKGNVIKQDEEYLENLGIEEVFENDYPRMIIRALPVDKKGYEMKGLKENDMYFLAYRFWMKKPKLALIYMPEEESNDK